MISGTACRTVEHLRRGKKTGIVIALLGVASHMAAASFVMFGEELGLRGLNRDGLREHDPDWWWVLGAWALGWICVLVAWCRFRSTLSSLVLGGAVLITLGLYKVCFSPIF